MTDAPSTILVLLLFALIFTVCILWATRGHPGANNEDLSVVAKDH